LNRDYADGKADNVQFFTGLEVEHTAAYGMETLFVTGVHAPEMISAMAKEQNVGHIYCGANQSYNPKDVAELKAWDHMITNLLKAGFWVTLDYDAKFHEDVLESSFNEYRKFISMISVKLPYLTQLNYNATIKLDDKGFEATNPGVWTLRLHDLLDSEKFTDWDQYGNDETL